MQTISVFGLAQKRIVAKVIESLCARSAKGLHWVDLGTGGGEFLSGVVRCLSALTRSKLVEPQAIDVAASGTNVTPPFRFVAGDIREFLKQDASYDCLSLFEVVEHFEKNEAIELIRKAQSKCSNLLISTPRGFLKQDGETHAEHANNPFQWHRCGFEIGELHALGFHVIVLENYHIAPPGHRRCFDSLVAYAGPAEEWQEIEKALQKLKFKNRFVPWRALQNFRKKLRIQRISF